MNHSRCIRDDVIPVWEFDHSSCLTTRALPGEAFIDCGIRFMQVRQIYHREIIQSIQEIFQRFISKEEDDRIDVPILVDHVQDEVYVETTVRITTNDKRGKELLKMIVDNQVEIVKQLNTTVSSIQCQNVIIVRKPQLILPFPWIQLGVGLLVVLVVLVVVIVLQKRKSNN